MDDVPRPVAPTGPLERAREWLDWFGVARLVTSAIAVAVVCAGAWFLLRAPVPPSEAALPRASPPAVAATGPAATLAPPDAASPTSGADVASPTVVVHVAGAVGRPGVYELRAGSRVDAALTAAGGPSGSADVDVLNLAAVVADGARVYVPEVGEAVPATAPVSVAAGDPVALGPIDVNSATVDALETLPGVGPATATAIVTDRDTNGPFVSVDDLERVPGIGPAKLAALRDLVTT